jgi:hypothetical protein
LILNNLHGKKKRAERKKNETEMMKTTPTGDDNKKIE